MKTLLSVEALKKVHWCADVMLPRPTIAYAMTYAARALGTDTATVFGRSVIRVTLTNSEMAGVSWMGTYARRDRHTTDNLFSRHGECRLTRKVDDYAPSGWARRMLASPLCGTTSASALHLNDF